jgi:hypothetical protein
MKLVGYFLIAAGLTIEAAAIYLAQRDNEHLNLALLFTGIATLCLGIVLAALTVD